MKAPSSIRFRLMAANILVKQVVILAAALVLLHTFDRLIHTQARRELAEAANQLAQTFRPSDSAGEEPVATVSDPRFAAPLSGRSWQIEHLGKPYLRSRSLGSTYIDLPQTGHDAVGTPVRGLNGPDGQTLVAIASRSPANPSVTIVTAMDSDELAALKNEFRNYVILALGGIAALLLTSAWIQVTIGLKPAEMMRSSIERIRLGQERRIGPGFPDELTPLIDETNRLLEAQEVAVQRARARAGDLAHGLKTPLTAMTMLNGQLRDAGEGDIAEEIAKQLETMSRHIYRELSRTRIAASSGLAFRTDLNSVAERVRNTMARLPNGDRLDWHVDIEADAPVSMEEDDVIELLANLFDNARKWARTEVCLIVRKSQTAIGVCIEDDGPGVPRETHARILMRDIRLDESVPGTGLGLTIVKDIVEAYCGTIELYEAAMGGLGVRLTLPAPGTAQFRHSRGVGASVTPTPQPFVKQVPSREKLLGKPAIGASELIEFS